ncbi:hypothetical protein P4S72_00095 [Vibrio sp. PP-XX7]
MLSTVACSIATLLLIGSWQRYYMSNIQHSDAVLTKVNEFKNELPSDIYKATQRDMLDSLNKIREATLEFGFSGINRVISPIWAYIRDILLALWLKKPI